MATGERIVTIDIEKEMKRSYLAYSMSVISGSAVFGSRILTLRLHLPPRWEFHWANGRKTGCRGGMRGAESVGQASRGLTRFSGL